MASSSASAPPTTITLHPRPSNPPPTPQFSFDNPLPKLIQTPSGLTILELQGTFNFPTELVNEENQNPEPVEIGRIEFEDYDPESNSTAWMKRVHMYVGQHQRLLGEVKKLAKPLGVVARRKRKTTEEEDETEVLEVLEIVKYKIVFSQRPEPVTTVT
ncbi:Ctf8-domain-containing protein [Apodospora peruviana]|uniref:Ctf8-domain-containing protein n=1 Tax=Apodospora peruviana TaxID=516989 RepID=A0AAE0HYN6_9PEZI|nr:Ctf8-domain-containing protein [Apodospora peruviana]